MNPLNPLDYAPYTNRDIPTGGRDVNPAYEGEAAWFDGDGKLWTTDAKAAQDAYPECEVCQEMFKSGWTLAANGYGAPRISQLSPSSKIRHEGWVAYMKVHGLHEEG